MIVPVPAEVVGVGTFGAIARYDTDLTPDSRQRPMSSNGEDAESSPQPLNAEDHR